MGRRRGSRDFGRRRKRSDIGKKRKYYAKKPTKKRRKVNGRFVPYKSKRKGYEPISIWFQEKRRMSKEGYYKWNLKMRAKLDRTVKPFIDRPIKVHPNEISTHEKIGDLAIHILKKPGLFNLCMPSASKSSWRVSYKKKAVIRITEVDRELHAKVTNFSKMRHYGWFFKG